MTEQVYKYKVKDTVTGESEERFICGATEELRNKSAVNNYGEIEELVIVSSKFVGNVDTFKGEDFTGLEYAI